MTLPRLLLADLYLKRQKKLQQLSLLRLLQAGECVPLRQRFAAVRQGMASEISVARPWCR